ncbi:MAG TPA: 3-dehydroquinate synthase [Terriglobia bacterium]|nr:3-dehydroquinate synthase [Terriglobia bacterium]
MQTFTVHSDKFDYNVVVGEGAWRSLRDFPRDHYTSTFIITEKPLWKIWGEPFLHDSGLQLPNLLLVPPGEASKSLRALGNLAAELLRQGADRRSLLVLLGGGVIGDLGGFVASVYMRGIDYIHVPTTILAQVDSSIGGKTAVNLGEMKNLIGTFYPPKLVISEPRVLRSLTPRDFRSGLYEVIKHAILDGPDFFSQLEGCADSLRPDNIDLLAPILPLAARVKVEVVNRDEREANLRMTLNLGHTFGHALEEATHYRRFVHGEAVGWGLLAISRLGQRLRLLESSEGERLESLVRRFGPLPPVRDLPASKILSLLPQDKKAVAGRIQWVIPEKIGKVRVETGVPEKAVAATFREIQKID